MIPQKSRKILKFNRGVLENAGLGEVSFYLKKAKQDILYATIALEHTDLSSFSEFTAIQANIVILRNLIVTVSEGMDQAECSIIAAVVQKDFDEE